MAPLILLLGPAAAAAAYLVSRLSGTPSGPLAARLDYFTPPPGTRRPDKDYVPMVWDEMRGQWVPERLPDGLIDPWAPKPAPTPTPAPNGYAEAAEQARQRAEAIARQAEADRQRAELDAAALAAQAEQQRKLQEAANTQAAEQQRAAAEAARLALAAAEQTKAEARAALDAEARRKAAAEQAAKAAELALAAEASRKAAELAGNTAAAAQAEAARQSAATEAARLAEVARLAGEESARNAAAALAAQAERERLASIAAQQAAAAANLAAQAESARKAGEAAQAESDRRAAEEKSNAEKAAAAKLAQEQAAEAAKQQAGTLRSAAEQLRDFLTANPTAAAYGYKGAPSSMVGAFQKVAGLPVDGIVGPNTRAAAASVGVTLPQRPSSPSSPSSPSAPAPALDGGPGSIGPDIAAWRAECARHGGTIQQWKAPNSTYTIQVCALPDGRMLAPSELAELRALPIAPSSPSSTTEPVPSGIPVGYSPALAKQLAPRIEAELRALTAKGQAYNYSRPNMKAFQTAAGLKPDGAYGGGTRGALVFYGAPRAPAPLFAPTTTIPYSPIG